ncbi:MAG: hypothetical protein ABIL11_02650, partial [Chloroflexota bacterium]
MTNVALREYNREIEGLIENGRVDEALSHCQHSLKTFPMYIETYRLLGKALLEVRRYGDAADIFQRILMAVPDDFVAHVGMSIIRDDEAKVDEAIWHMERAFEIQPSNPAIQSELKRLYGRRDGIEPRKVRLTRDALANMYTQGELYNQAIAEIRSVMAEDANRPDLQVMLARAYYRAGQKVEATEMSMALLKKYPYCLDALRVLVDILPGTGRAEDAKVYRQRVEQLDPYTAFVKDSVFQSDQVDDSAVSLQRLEYQPVDQAEAIQPGWTSSLGIRLTPATLPEARAERPQASVSFEPPAFAEPAAAKSEGDIPDWLRSAGWQEATGEAQEVPLDSAGESQGAGPIARAEIPDWLTAMAPSEAADQMNVLEPASPQPTAETKALLITPFEKMPEEPEKVPERLSKPTSPFEGVKAGAAYEEILESTPDWMKGLTAPEETPPPAVEPTAPIVVEQEPPEPVTAVFEPPSLEDQDAALAWLENLAAKQGARPEELLTRPEDRSETPPEWVRKEMGAKPVEPAETGLASLPSEPEAKEVAQPAFQELASSEFAAEPPAAAFIEAETLTWLDGLRADQDARPEELPVTAPDLEQGAPILSDVVEPVAATPVEIQPPVQETIADRVGAAQGLPADSQEIAEGLPAETIPVLPEEDVASWLKNLEASDRAGAAHRVGAVRKTGEKIPVSQSQPEPSSGEELPDWLRGIDRPTWVAEPSKEEELPEWLIAPAEVPGGIEGSEMAIPGADENATIPAILPPTTPEEWLPAETMEAEATEPAVVEPEAPAPEPVQPVPEPAASAPQPTLSPMPGVVGELARVPSQDKDADTLQNAQIALKNGKLNDAMAGYAKLIKKQRLLAEVIHDLREGVYTFPVDIIIWQ